MFFLRNKQDRHCWLTTEENKKWERAQPLRSETKVGVGTKLIEIKNILRPYYEQCFSVKLDNLENMDRFLNIFKLNKEEVESLNKPMVSKKTETVIKK